MVDQQTYNFNRDLLNNEKHARLMNLLLITQLDCRVSSIRWDFFACACHHSWLELSRFEGLWGFESLDACESSWPACDGCSLGCTAILHFPLSVWHLERSHVHTYNHKHRHLINTRFLKCASFDLGSHTKTHPPKHTEHSVKPPAWTVLRLE